MSEIKNIEGTVFQLVVVPISRCSCSQTEVATSTDEEEYFSLRAACKDAVWLKQILQGWGPEFMLDLVFKSGSHGANRL